MKEIFGMRPSVVYARESASGPVSGENDKPAETPNLRATQRISSEDLGTLGVTPPKVKSEAPIPSEGVVEEFARIAREERSKQVPPTAGFNPKRRLNRWV